MSQEQSQDKACQSIFSPSSPLFYFFSHHSIAECSSHCVAIPVKGKKVFLCSRCTGVFLGGIVLSILLSFWTFSLSELLKFIFSFFLGGMLVIEWFFYKYGISSSSAHRRLVSGWLGGMGIRMMATIQNIFLKSFAYGTAFFLLVIVYVVKLKKEL